MTGAHRLVERQTPQDPWGGPCSPPQTEEPRASSPLGPESQLRLNSQSGPWGGPKEGSSAAPVKSLVLELSLKFPHL